MEKYDVIVVGAGTAGLFCANFLARYGKKTLLLEHNHQPGGLTGGFWRKKFYFDAGDQSFESGGIMIPLLKNLGLYRPEDWEFADYTIAYEHGSVVMKDQKKALNELVDLYPEQRQEMLDLFTYMIRCGELLGAVSNDQSSPIDKSGLARFRALVDLGKTVISNRKEMEGENETLSSKLDETQHQAEALQAALEEAQQKIVNLQRRLDDDQVGSEDNRIALQELKTKLQATQAKFLNAQIKIKKLGKMMPVCSSCKKIRDDEGFWRELDNFINNPAHAELLQGVCPDCEKPVSVATENTKSKLE